MEWCSTTFIFAVIVLTFILSTLTVLFLVILVVARVEFIHVRIRHNDAVEE